MTRIFLNVSGDPHGDVPTISTDEPRVYPGVFESANRCIVTLDAHATGGGHLHYDGRTLDFLLPPPGGDYEGAALGLPPLIYEVDPPKVLRPEGWHFVKADGARWIAALHSDFKLLKLWLDGERGYVDDLLAQRIFAGSQGPRVFGTCGFLFQLDPRAYGNYYEEVRAFADHLAHGGLYWELTALTDQQRDLFDGFDQQAYWRQLNEAMEGSANTLLELGNENQQNGVKADEFRKISSLPVSTGSYCDGWEPTGSWDYVTFHPRRDAKWPSTVAGTVNELRDYPGQNKPILINEPIGSDEINQPGRRSTDVESFERMAVDCALWAAGGCFHSQAGLGSEPWGPIQTACAQAFFQGLRR